MNILYRKLQPGESGIYRKIRLESLKKFPDCFGSTYEEEIQAKKLGYETYIEEQTPGRFIIGTFADDTLIGICGFFRETSQKVKHRGAIIQMYVDPVFKGQQIGRTLLQKTIEEAFTIQEVEQLVLGVVTGNKSANKIYEDAGFKEYGFIRDYLKSDRQYADQRLMILYRRK